MNFKKIFFILLLASSIISVKAVKVDTTEELKLLQEVASLATKNASDTIFLLFHNKTKKEILENLSQAPVGILLLVYHCAKSELQELSGLLHYVQQEKPELIQQAFDRYVSQEKIDFPMVETFIKFGANSHENFPGKNYNAEEALKARFESNNCNGMWSKLFGKSYECKEKEKGLNFFEKLKKQKEIAIEKANEIADAAEGN